MNAIREAVGDKKMTYLGFSYGTFLGATIQSLFPGKTRAVVLDGALDPDQYMNDPLGSLDEQTAGFERAIGRFFTACAADQAACPFGAGDPKGTIDDLIEQADASPIPASNAPDRPVDGDDIRASLAQEVYSIYAWPELRDALVPLEAGDGAGIRDIADGFYGREEDGSYSPGTDRYFLLSADEQNYPRRIEPFLKAGKASYFDYDYAFWNHGYSELNWGLYPVRAKDKYDGPFRTTRRTRRPWSWAPDTTRRRPTRRPSASAAARQRAAADDDRRRPHRVRRLPGRRVQLGVHGQGGRGLPDLARRARRGHEVRAGRRAVPGRGGRRDSPSRCSRSPSWPSSADAAAPAAVGRPRGSVALLEQRRRPAPGAA